MYIHTSEYIAILLKRVPRNETTKTEFKCGKTKRKQRFVIVFSKIGVIAN